MNTEMDGESENPSSGYLKENISTEKMSSAILDQAEGLIAKINLKRKQDGILLTKIKKSLEDQVEHIMKSLEQKLNETYEKHREEAQQKVDLLWQILQDASQLQTEIDSFKSALGQLYDDIEAFPDE